MVKEIHMNNDYNEIILKAREISSLINNHEITKKYKETQMKIQKDAKANELLRKLIAVGAELTQDADKQGAVGNISPAENQLLMEDMEKSPVVKDFILAQKEYLNMLNLVIEKIKNPD